jgi:prepilin-type N-terminal cleavage/methylation domain-containing protein
MKPVGKMRKQKNRGFIPLLPRPCTQERGPRARAGFTLIEMLMVVIIVGILASIGVGSYTKTVEMSRARLAINNLRMIYQAERIHHAEEGQYYPLTVGLTIPETTFNPVLHTAIESSAQEYSYTISRDGANSFLATAARNGPYGCVTITINQLGTYGHAGTWPTGFNPGW